MESFVSEFIEIKEIGLSDTGKTKIFGIYSASHVMIGQIKWHGAFRKYALSTLNGMIFDSRCLRDIAKFCDLATREKKGY